MVRWNLVNIEITDLIIMFCCENSKLGVFFGQALRGSLVWTCSLVRHKNKTIKIKMIITDKAVAGETNWWDACGSLIILKNKLYITIEK